MGTPIVGLEIHVDVDVELSTTARGYCKGFLYFTIHQGHIGAYQTNLE